MDCKLQTTNVGKGCVTLCPFISLTYCAIQVFSLSYHAASGNIIVGLHNGHVEMWQTDPHIDHACVRERLSEAQAQADDIQASLDKADSGLRQQISREQKLKRSITDLEAKCAHISNMYL